MLALNSLEPSYPGKEQEEVKEVYEQVSKGNERERKRREEVSEIK